MVPGNILNVRNVVAFLLASAILLPFVPIAGPLSTDDLMPLLALALSLIVVPFYPRTTNRLVDTATLALLLFAAVVMFSAAFNSHTLGGFLKMIGKSSGRLLFFALLVLSCRVLFHTPDKVKTALIIFAGFATIEAIFCVWAYKNQYQGPYGIGIADVPGWSVIKGHVRVHGTFSGALSVHEKAQVSSNFLASYLVLSLPVTMGLFLEDRRRWVRLAFLVSALLQLITLYLTYTRASLVALGVGVLAMGWLLRQRKWAVFALFSVVVITLSVPAMRAKFQSEGHNRYSLWSASVNTFKESPVFGIGDGKYMSSLTQNHHLHDTDFGVANATAHNSVLMSAANYGIFGMLAHILLYACLLGGCLTVMSRIRGRQRFLAAGIAAAIICYLVQDQFNNLHYVPKVSTQMWFLFALLPMLCVDKDPQTPASV